MLQAIGKYLGATFDDPHLHLKKLLEVASNFKIPRIIGVAFELRYIPYSLRDGVNSCLNLLEPNSIATRNNKYFSSVKNAKMRNEITFSETRMDNCFMLMKDLRGCKDNVYIIEVHFLSIENILQWSYSIIKKYVERIIWWSLIIITIYCCPKTKATFDIINKKPFGVHEVNETTAFNAKVAPFHILMKALMTQHKESFDEQVNVGINCN